MTDESTSDAPAEGSEPTGRVYGLRWGIKASFLSYLKRMPDGRGAVGEGAIPVGDDDVLFVLEGDPITEPDRIEWSFSGDVRFSGHFGMLFVRLARPMVTGTPEAAVLTIEGDEGERVPLVTLALVRQGMDADLEVWSSTEVVLTQEGTEIFNEVYPVGEPFEQVLVGLPAAPPA